MSPLLDVADLTSGYGPVRVLDRIRLRVESGESVGVLGANGAGKTTLLRTISGMIRLRSGAVRFEDRDVGGLPSHRITQLGVGHVPEGRGLFPGLTLRENLIAGGYGAGRRAADAATVIDEAVELFPWIRDRLSQPAGTLSGGEQQMVAIARGLAAQPKILLLDEPSLGLSPQVRGTIVRALARVQERGVSLLVVEQNVEIALGLCRRAYLIKKGAVALEAESERLREEDALLQEAYFA